MVDATQFEKLELYRDPDNSDRFIARDPSDDAIYAIPFEEIESTDATITNNLTVDGTTTTDTLEAERSSIGNVVSSVRISSGTDISNETFTQLEISDIYEEDDEISIDNTNNVFNVTNAGAYLVTVNPTINAPSAPEGSRYIIEVVVDGSDRSPRAMSRYMATFSSSTYQLPTATWVGRVNANSDISVEIWQSTGETVETAANQAKIEVMRLG